MHSSRKPASFIARLKKLVLSDKTMLEKIRNNEASSRLFDNMPSKFDAVFEETNIDAERLGNILSDIRASHTSMTDRGPMFTKEADKARIKNWSKRFMARFCSELLDENNAIDPTFLDLVAKTPSTLSSRDLVCAYFSIANQYMIKKIVESDDSKVIDSYVMKAYIQFMNQYPKWVAEVLKERLLTVKPPYLNDSPRESVDDVNFDFKLGICSALIGLFFIGSAAAYSAYQNSKKTNNEREPAEPEQHESDEQSPYGWTFLP